MGRIKNIIFDLGGVLFEVDYNKTSDAFINLGVLNFDNYYKHDFVSVLFEKLEIGSISPEIFYIEFRNITHCTLTNQQIEIAWNAMLGNFYIDRLDYLKELKKEYNLFLFSNTNEIHFENFNKKFFNLYHNRNLSSFFVKDYYSHLLKKRKPNVDSYKKIIYEQQLILSETLFIDDILKNIDGAKNAGLQVLHLLPTMDLKTELEILLEINKQLN